MSNIPSKIFVVPYRDRIQHKFFFSRHMSFILEDKNDYEILFVHQYDDRVFNRGAMKNIGFLAIKAKYPKVYKNITIVFNDIDTVPFHKIFEYETIKGVVKHFYGFKYALGGILAIKGADFEKINGFPNLWGWGLEDTCLQKRCEANNLFIDRTEFYELGSPKILQLFDGLKRIVTRQEVKQKDTTDGLRGIDGVMTVHNLVYTVNDKSLNPTDNEYIFENPNINYVNVVDFETLKAYEENDYTAYDIRTLPENMFKDEKLLNSDNDLDWNTEVDLKWTNIPGNEINPLNTLNENEPMNDNNNGDDTSSYTESDSDDEYVNPENPSIDLLKNKYQDLISTKKRGMSMFFTHN